MALFRDIAGRAGDMIFSGFLALICVPLFCFFAIATLTGAFKPGGIHLAERQEEDFHQAEADRRYAESLRDMADA